MMKFKLQMPSALRPFPASLAVCLLLFFCVLSCASAQDSPIDAAEEE
jgi:hypothetical protein